MCRTPAVVSLLLAGHVAIATAAPVFDEGATSIDLYRTPSVGVSLADLDEDGALDLMAPTHNGFLVRRGDGAGRFGAPSFFQTMLYATVQWARLADIDGDGTPDVVTHADGSSAWARGLGGTQFDVQANLPPTGPAGPVVLFADLDGNVSVDFVFSGEGVRLQAILDPGGANPDSMNDIPYATSAHSLGVADLDGDGIPDLVAAFWDQWGLFKGGGSGDFPVFTAVGGAVERIFVADLDHDGAADILAGSRVFRGDGAGAFVAAVDLGTVPDQFEDADGDGHRDLIRFLADGVEIRAGSGSPSFAFAAPQVWPTGAGPREAAFGDLDGDGRVDMVVACGSTPLATVLLASAQGGYRVPPSFPAGDEPVAIVAGEFTGDAHADLATADRGDATVAVLPGAGDGTFGAPIVHAAPAGVTALIARDLDGDGRLDLITAAEAAGVISVFPGLAGGGFGARLDWAAGGAPARIAPGDWNGDMHDDLVVVDRSAKTLAWLAGDGGFGFGPPVAFAGVLNAFEAALLDQNHDGHLDIVYRRVGASPFSTENRILHGDGAGGVLGEGATPEGCASRSAWYAAGDVDGDGWSDLVVAARKDSAGAVESCLGTAGVSAGGAVAPSVTSVLLADVDGDGHLDALTTSDHANALTVRLGLGDGTFGERHDHVTGAGASGVAVADFDGDGRPDVAVSNARANTVSVLGNLTPPTAAVPAPGSVPRLALGHIAPNPSRGPFAVRFVVASAGPVRLELWDVSGRRVEQRELGSLGAGAHTAVLGQAPRAPGVYLVRLVQGPAVRQGVVVLLR